MTIKLKGTENIQIHGSDNISAIMQKILSRENRIDRNREHLWTVSLDSANKILNIELVSMGSVNQTVVHPMEVFSVPLQKRAVSIIIVHNHPSGTLKPSDADKDITDRLIQCGLIMELPVMDHLIITEKTYFSFADSGLLDELKQSKKYVPDFKIKDAIKKQVVEELTKNAKEERNRELAKMMKAKNYKSEEIAELTGIDKKIIDRIQIE